MALTTLPIITYEGQDRPAQPIILVDPSGDYAGGGGGGGGGDASAANQTAMITRMGEVQASPTANTLLDRLKVLHTDLTAIAGSVDGLEGYVDTLETLIAATNALLTTQNGYVDGIEGQLTTIAGYLDTVETKLDTLHTDITAGTIGTGTAGSPNTTTVLSVQSPGDTATPLRAVNPCDVVSVTPTLDTSAYAAGDVLFDSTSVTIFRANDQRALLTSVSITDKSDNKPALKLFFFSANVSLGTFNAAPSISDANAVNFIGSVTIAAADYDDLGGVSVACQKNIGLLLESVSGAQTIYVAAVLTAGTPTFANGDLVLRLGVVQS